MSGAEDFEGVTVSARNLRRGCLIFVAVAIVGVLGAGFIYDHFFGIQAQGEKLVLKIEKFRVEKGRLPDNLEEMGMKEPGPMGGVDTPGGLLWYEKKDDKNYIVYYGEQLGVSMVYDSKTKEWGEHN